MCSQRPLWRGGEGCSSQCQHWHIIFASFPSLKINTCFNYRIVEQKSSARIPAKCWNNVLMSLFFVNPFSSHWFTFHNSKLTTPRHPDVEPPIPRPALQPSVILLEVSVCRPDATAAQRLSDCLPWLLERALTFHLYVTLYETVPPRTSNLETQFGFILRRGSADSSACNPYQLTRLSHVSQITAIAPFTRSHDILYFVSHTRTKSV